MYFCTVSSDFLIIDFYFVNKKIFCKKTSQVKLGQILMMCQLITMLQMFCCSFVFQLVQE